MAYKHSQIDKDNLKWFPNDVSNASLLKMRLIGSLRGVKNCSVDFKYPITVISGKNGSGKSTLLAMAACGYHNEKNGFRLRVRKNTYYTFSDFFIQSTEDVKPDGIYIGYNILYDSWNRTREMPDGKGLGYQVRRKKRGGRWNNYERRVNRNVVVLGIERVVPHSEKSTYKSYRTKFRDEPEEGFEFDVRENVGFVLGKNYSSLHFRKYNRYKLPVVVSENVNYSGFNMGAGENALFELFYIIHKLPKGSLLIVDEIELGLHEGAQSRLMEVLKKICLRKKHQIICTSHSPKIIKSVPPEARIHIEKDGDTTKIVPEITSLYATGKLREENSRELDVYVEDKIAKSLVNDSVDNKLRQRISIIPIGSDMSVIRQMAARFKHKELGKCICLLDGDKQSETSTLEKNFLHSLESVKDKDKAKSWIKDRLFFLPGKDHPEKWIIQELLKTNLERLANLTRCSKTDIKKFLKKALSFGKHQEFAELSRQCGIDLEIIINYAISTLRSENGQLVKPIERNINKALKS